MKNPYLKDLVDTPVKVEFSLARYRKNQAEAWEQGFKAGQESHKQAQEDTDLLYGEKK